MQTKRRARLTVAIAIIIISLLAGLVAFPILQALASSDMNCKVITTGKICRLVLPLVYQNGNNLPTPAPTQNPFPTVTYPPPVTPQVISCTSTDPVIEEACQP